MNFLEMGHPKHDYQVLLFVFPGLKKKFLETVTTEKCTWPRKMKNVHSH